MKLTLQNRITTLMITTSVLLISAFMYILLNNQLDNITQYTSYQATLSSKITKDSLETVLKKKNPKDFPEALHTNLKTLTDSSIIRNAVVFDKEGAIIAATKDQLVGKNVRFRELEKWRVLDDPEKNIWLVPEVDRLRRELDIFIGVRRTAQEPILYVSKISFSLGNIQTAFFNIYQTIILTTMLIFLANIVLGYLLSKNVIGPIKFLNKVTKIIAEGDLSIRTNIATNDELQELGETFNYMTEELVKMKQRAENANPLTKLPGNIVIHDEVEKRIAENRKFVVIYSDLDNFKAFNDKYGISKGDEAIKLAANIFKDSIQQKGNINDFLGHEGGDDFILLTTPEKAEGVADYITKEFDTRIRTLYSPEDQTQGYIIAHARDGTIKQFPIMTISLAGVTNEYRALTSYGEVTNIASEVKKKAKAIDASVFVMDKRRA